MKPIRLMIAVLVGVSMCDAEFRHVQSAAPQDAPLPASGDRLAPRHSDGDVDEWPFVARINVLVDYKRATRRGVLLGSISNDVAAAACASLEEIRNVILTANDRTRVRLHEIASVDVAVVRRGGVLENGGRQGGDGGYHCLARIALRMDEGALSKMELDRNDVAKVLSGMSGDREYHLEDIRSLTVPRRNATSVPLGRVAKIDIVFRRRPFDVSSPPKPEPGTQPPKASKRPSGTP